MNSTRAGSWAPVFAIAVLLAFALSVPAQTAAPAVAPPAPIRPVTDDYFGRKIVDPYRYMENLKDPQVESWFKGQNDYTRSLLDRIPARAALLARIKTLDESSPARVFDVRHLPGDRYFYQKRLASEDVAKLFTRSGLNGAETLLVDPAKLATSAGAHYSINYYAPSFDGRYVAYGVSPSGSEDAVLRIVETATARDTGEVIDRAQFGSASWLPDGRSFFFNRLQATGPQSKPTDRYLKSKMYLHVVGKSPESDVAVLGFDLSPKVHIEEADIPFVATVPGTNYVFGLSIHGVQNEATIYVAPLNAIDKPGIPWQKICDVEDEVTSFDVQGSDLYLLTHKNASRFKITRTDLAHPDVVKAEVILPASELVIRNFAAAQDGLYVQASDGAIGRLIRVPYKGGKPESIPLPFQGTVGIASSDPRLPGILVDLTSWTKANKIYAYDPRSRQLSDTRLQPAGPFDDPPDVESVEVKVASYDGMEVPLSITHKRGLKLDASNPTLLNGYGSYGISLDPGFDRKRLAWLERGGVFAVAHVRGGGEYGEDWHIAGRKLTKPNTWRDFIACAEYLIAHKYTSSVKLGIEGGSAGGITVGRSITTRPDLFAAAIDAVPVSDAVRGELTPNGPPNIPEFGSAKTLSGFEDLYAMSAFHHVQDGTAYPAVLLTTGFNDPRVISWQPGKLTARLQAATSSAKPILLRVDYDAGHGIGSTKTQRQVELADEWSFLFWQFGVPEFQPAR